MNKAEELTITIKIDNKGLIRVFSDGEIDFETFKKVSKKVARLSKSFVALMPVKENLRGRV